MCLDLFYFAKRLKRFFYLDHDVPLQMLKILMFFNYLKREKMLPPKKNWFVEKEENLTPLEQRTKQQFPA